VKIVGVMQTPDEVWRVEALRQGARFWYRVVQREPDAPERVYDHLTIGGVEQILAKAGVDRASLVQVDDAS
jgi:hypothetical protein